MAIFAIQNGGQCRGADNHGGYEQYGRAENCRNGKGGLWASNVYLVQNPTSHPKGN